MIVLPDASRMAGCRLSKNSRKTLLLEDDDKDNNEDEDLTTSSFTLGDSSLTWDGRRPRRQGSFESFSHPSSSAGGSSHSLQEHQDDGEDEEKEWALISPIPKACNNNNKQNNQTTGGGGPLRRRIQRRFSGGFGRGGRQRRAESLDRHATSAAAVSSGGNPTQHQATTTVMLHQDKNQHHKVTTTGPVRRRRLDHTAAAPAVATTTPPSQPSRPPGKLAKRHSFSGFIDLTVPPKKSMASRDENHARESNFSRGRTTATTTSIQNTTSGPASRKGGRRVVTRRASFTSPTSSHPMEPTSKNGSSVVPRRTRTQTPESIQSQETKAPIPSQRQRGRPARRASFTSGMTTTTTTTTTTIATKQQPRRQPLQTTKTTTARGTHHHDTKTPLRRGSGVVIRRRASFGGVTTSSNKQQQYRDQEPNTKLPTHNQQLLSRSKKHLNTDNRVVETSHSKLKKSCRMLLSTTPFAVPKVDSPPVVPCRRPVDPVAEATDAYWEEQHRLYQQLYPEQVEQQKDTTYSPARTGIMAPGAWKAQQNPLPMSQYPEPAPKQESSPPEDGFSNRGTLTSPQSRPRMARRRSAGTMAPAASIPMHLLPMVNHQPTMPNVWSCPKSMDNAPKMPFRNGHAKSHTLQAEPLADPNLSKASSSPPPRNNTVSTGLVHGTKPLQTPIC